MLSQNARRTFVRILFTHTQIEWQKESRQPKAKPKNKFNAT